MNQMMLSLRFDGGLYGADGNELSWLLPRLDTTFFFVWTQMNSDGVFVISPNIHILSPTLAAGYRERRN